MNLSWRVFSKEFKLEAVRRLEAASSAAQVARSLEINPNMLHRWRRELQGNGARAFPGLGRRRADEDRIAELERKVGQQALEIDFLKRLLQRVEEAPRLQALSGGKSSTGRSKKR
jgi:transposase-like protein